MNRYSEAPRGGMIPDQDGEWCFYYQAEHIEKLYCELLFAVATKFPDESRHETALRYILQAENRSTGIGQGAKNE